MRKLINQTAITVLNSSSFTLARNTKTTSVDKSAGKYSVYFYPMTTINNVLM